MMLIIADKSPDKAVDWLVKNTNKNFCFKQLLELGQLICSAGISNVFKPIKQGKELQEWIKNNKLWVDRYFTYLFNWSIKNIDLKRQTYDRLFRIRLNLLDSIDYIKIKYPQTVIFRYVKEYAEFTGYESNSELPTSVATVEYKKYLEWKFKKEVSVCS